LLLAIVDCCGPNTVGEGGTVTITRQDDVGFFAWKMLANYADDAGIGLSTARAALRSLEDMGAVRLVRGGHGPKSTHRVYVADPAGRLFAASCPDPRRPSSTREPRVSHASSTRAPALYFIERQTVCGDDATATRGLWQRSRELPGNAGADVAQARDAFRSDGPSSTISGVNDVCSRSEAGLHAPTYKAPEVGGLRRQDLSAKAPEVGGLRRQDLAPILPSDHSNEPPREICSVEASPPVPVPGTPSIEFSQSFLEDLELLQTDAELKARVWPLLTSIEDATAREKFLRFHVECHLEEKQRLERERQRAEARRTG
jgi:hypothetical protein